MKYYVLILLAGLLGSAGSSATSQLLLALGVILVVAKLGARLAGLFNLPDVLGELAIGVLLGNLALLGLPDLRSFFDSPGLRIFSDLGVIFLLFAVGVETDLVHFLRVGWPALRVALVGVVAPVCLGYATSALFFPDASILQHIFIGCTLSATSIGITARVFKDLNVLDRRFSKIVLGAAVIDDVLGLILLTIITKLITSGSSAGLALDVAILTLSSCGFLVIALLLGRELTAFLIRTMHATESKHALSFIALAACLLLSYLSELVGLAAAIGAFTAGLLVTEGSRKLKVDLIHDTNSVFTGILSLFTPVFFVLIGMQVNLGILAHGHSSLFVLVLLAVAAISKIVSGFVAKDHSWAIGLGMMPRGEVGLIFVAAGQGAKVVGQPFMSNEIFSALILVILLTTLACPPALAWTLRKDA